MEPLTSTKRLILIGTALILAVAATAGILSYRRLSQVPLGKMVRGGLPMLDLTVILRDRDNKNLDAHGTLLGSNEKPPVEVENPHCPTLIGGDSSSATVIGAWDKRPADCPQQAFWYVKQHPIALTLYFHQGEAFLKWWDGQAQIKTLRDSHFMQGLFFGLLKSMKIKAEELHLQGLQGEFLNQLLRDAIGANAELHYDMSHGERGWVLAYQRSDSAFAEQALPAMAGLLADNGYQLDNLPEPILAMRIGLQHFFLTEYDQHIYLAQSLEALLNVLENKETMEEYDEDVPLRLVLRTDAFVDHLPAVLTTSAKADIALAFTLQANSLGNLQLPAGPWQTPLHDKIFEGVLASIPHDVFAAVATSFRIPATLTSEDWQRLSSNGPPQSQPGPEPGGLALLWDFDKATPGGAIGIVIANPGEPQASPAYRQYLRNGELGEECAGGSVFLAASSQGLLNRMKEACARQSLSPLDWQHGVDKPRYLSAQLVSFINPGTAMRELFLAGGAGDNTDESDLAPRWQQNYEQAKAAMRQDGEKLFRSLPIFSYAGRVANDNGVASLEGKAISQEAGQ
ncbi:MAG: hypothetical protein WAW36_19150 [Methylovulum miyakonense]|uniref:hypothetical protein n=1 Tax=Methylovulum miyakonense TaxID=645578 RepID=UPI003BB7A86D